MYYLLFSTIVGTVSLAIYFLSPIIANWIIAIAFGINAIQFLYKSFSEYNKFNMGESKSAGEIVAIASSPFTSSVIIISLIVLIITGYSMFHILWIAIVADFLFTYTIGVRAVKILNLHKYGKDWPI